MAKANEEHIKKLEEHYIQNDITLRELAQRSRQVCGIAIPFNTVHYLASKFRWGVLKTRYQMGKTGLPTSIADEADDIREQVFAKLMDPEEQLSVQDMATLISVWEKLQKVAPKQTTAKMDRQQVMDSVLKGERRKAQMVRQRADAGESNGPG